MKQTAAHRKKKSENVIRLIKTKKDDRTLERLEVIFDAKRNTPEGDELEVLSLLIEKYEEKHFPIDLPDPIEAIKFRLDQMGYNVKDLSQLIGLSSGRISEIMNRKRKLSIEMIRKFHSEVQIPTDVLIQAY